MDNGKMKPKFLTKLDVELISGKANNGRGLWVVRNPLVYESAIAGIISVPEGFKTDFASVPRIPLVFWLTGDTAHQAAVIHDFLYRRGIFDRATADEVLYEAMKVTHIPTWRAYAMFLAVRVFGSTNFRKGMK